MAREIIFCNLEAELARTKITRAELAGIIGISTGSMSSKFNGKTEFTLEEMEKIRDSLESTGNQKLTYDYLFKRGE